MFILLFIIAFFLADPATAMARNSCESLQIDNPVKILRKTPKNTEECYVNGDRLYITGLIGSRVLESLRSENKITTVYLNSPGGNVDMAKKIAAIIREQSKTTVVSYNSVCASACTLLFQAGTLRKAAKNALLIYHCITVGTVQKRHFLMNCGSTPDKYEGSCLKDLQNSIQATTDSTRSYFKENHLQLGMDPSFLDFFFSAQTNDSKWFKYANFCRHYYGMTPEESMAFNITQEIL